VALARSGRFSPGRTVCGFWVVFVCGSGEIWKWGCWVVGDEGTEDGAGVWGVLSASSCSLREEVGSD
jgi:hypothetical protein